MTNIKSKILEKLRLQFVADRNFEQSDFWIGVDAERARLLSLLDPILENYEECVRALSDGDQYSKSAALSKHEEIMGGGE